MTKLTNLTKKDFEDILENYDIGKYKSHKHIWWAMANTVYEIKTTKGKFILKVYETSNSKFIKQQIKVIDFLFKRNVPVPKILKAKNGNHVLLYFGKRITVEKYMEGKEPGKINLELARNLGKNVGKLDKNLMKLRLRDKALNETYGFERLRFSKRYLNKIDLKKVRRDLNKDLKKLNKTKLRKSIIHGDLCHSNILVKDNKIKTIIDWDDFHRDHFVYEIAIVIAHLFIKKNKVEREKVKKFLKEYQKHIKLNEEEKKALYYFIKQRILALVTWCMEQKEKHPDNANELNKWLDDIAGKYNQFNKISLREFLELVK